MSKIVEVARAMEAYCRDVMEKRGEASPEIYQRLGQPEWEELARAAIKAMREPTEEMRNAMEEDIDWDGDAVRAYLAGIDAALKEPKP